MADEALWLRRLSRASEYWELQEILGEMAAAVREATDSEVLLGPVEEAIERIRRERARDEDELREYEREYEAFREQQSGVVGWLKRHLPFTEVRAEEKRHKEEIAGQEAEILADNLAIARAQVLMESLLPAARRRMGHDTAHWQSRLEAEAADAATYAASRVQLAREIERGREFLDAVRADAAAFADARFPEKQDRTQQKADLEAARGELAALEEELDQKTHLRDEATRHLRALVTDDLERRDPGYRALAERAIQLDAARDAAGMVIERLEAVQEALEALRGRAEELDGLPARRADLRKKLEQQRAQAESAERLRLHAATLVAEHEARAGQAREVRREAETALAAAEKEHEDYVVRSGQAELPPGVSFEDSSPEAARLVRAQAALADARSALEVAAAPYETARGEAEQAASGARTARAEIERIEKRLSKLADEEARLHDALGDAQAELAPLLAEAPTAVDGYLEAIEAVDRASALADRDPLLRRRRFDVVGFERLPRDVRDFEDALERLGKLARTARSERDALQSEGEDARRGMQSAFAAHARALLGEAPAEEIFQ